MRACHTIVLHKTGESDWWLALHGFFPNTATWNCIDEDAGESAFSLLHTKDVLCYKVWATCFLAHWIDNLECGQIWLKPFHRPHTSPLVRIRTLLWKIWNLVPPVTTMGKSTNSYSCSALWHNEIKLVDIMVSSIERNLPYFTLTGVMRSCVGQPNSLYITI